MTALSRQSLTPGPGADVGGVDERRACRFARKRTGAWQGGLGQALRCDSGLSVLRAHFVEPQVEAKAEVDGLHLLFPDRAEDAPHPRLVDRAELVNEGE